MVGRPGRAGNLIGPLGLPAPWLDLAFEHMAAVMGALLFITAFGGEVVTPTGA